MTVFRLDCSGKSGSRTTKLEASAGLMICTRVTRSDLEVIGDSKATRDLSHCMHEHWGPEAMDRRTPDPVARLLSLEDGEVGEVDGVCC
jgi:hypothetical protein